MLAKTCRELWHELHEDLPVTLDWAATAEAREKIPKALAKYMLSAGEEL